MKLTKLFPLLVLPLSIVGCNNGPAPTPVNKDYGVTTVRLNAISKSSAYTLPFNYDVAYFSHLATDYDRDLMMLSYGASLSTYSEVSAKAFFNMMFDEVELSGYQEIIKDSIGIVLAHRVIDDFDLYAISLRGLDYGAEWANNFDIGSEGNHHGFTIKAEEVCNNLKVFKNKYHSKEKFKIWLTGYSRGGGVANVTADMIMRGGMEETDFYVYTFEAPKAINENNYVEYHNVINMIDSRDPITYIAPSKYDFVRCGVDMDFYDADYRNYVAEFDPTIELKTFTPDSGETPKYTDELSFLEHIFNSLLAEYVPASEDDEKFLPGDLSTREHFYNNYQAHIQYLFEFFMALTEEQMNQLMEFLNTDDNMAAAFFLLASATDSFYNFISPKLDEFGITYDSEKLLNATIQVGNLIQSHRDLVGEAISIYPAGINQTFVDNVMCLAMHHYPEIVYCSLKQFAYSD